MSRAACAGVTTPPPRLRAAPHARPARARGGRGWAPRHPRRGAPRRARGRPARGVVGAGLGATIGAPWTGLLRARHLLEERAELVVEPRLVVLLAAEFVSQIPERGVVFALCQAQRDRVRPVLVERLVDSRLDPDSHQRRAGPRPGRKLGG